MKPSLYAKLLYLLFSTAFLCSLQGNAAAMQISEVAGRAVTMELVKASDLSTVAWPAEEVKLVSETITTKAGDDIFRLLEANGIQPDNEAYTVVYDLNPNLEKVDPLPVGLSLAVPKLIAGPKLQEKLKSGHIVMLTVDKDIKEQFDRNVKAISDLSVRFAALGPGRFADIGKRNETINSVREMAAWLEHMRKTFARKTAKPLRRITLIQLNNEASALRALLELALTPDKKIGAVEQTRIAAIYKDIKQESEKWDQTMAGEPPSGEAQFTIVVEIKGGSPTQIQNLRVYYAIAGLFEDPPRNPPVPISNFNSLGQSSTARLPIKDYKVWAAPDGQPSSPVTWITDLYVRRPASGDVIKLDLSLKP